VKSGVKTREAKNGSGVAVENNGENQREMAMAISS
jgi:hypothetical protein